MYSKLGWVWLRGHKLRCLSRPCSSTDRVQPLGELPGAAVAPQAVPVRGCRARRRALGLPEGGSQQGERGALIDDSWGFWLCGCWSEDLRYKIFGMFNFSLRLCFQKSGEKDAVLSGAKKQEEPEVHVSGVKIFYGSQTGTAKVKGPAMFTHHSQHALWHVWPSWPVLRVLPKCCQRSWRLWVFLLRWLTWRTTIQTID